MALSTNGWWLVETTLRTDAWDEYRGVLASALDSGSWLKVARAIAHVRELEADLRRLVGDRVHDEQPDPVPLPGWLASKMQAARPQGREAYNALVRLAATEPVAVEPS